jgi:hypothetical protein
VQKISLFAKISHPQKHGTRLKKGLKGTTEMASSSLNSEKFCSSCFKYRPAEEVKTVLSANGKQRLLRCLSCSENRRKAKAAGSGTLPVKKDETPSG